MALTNDAGRITADGLAEFLAQVKSAYAKLDEWDMAVDMHALVTEYEPLLIGLLKDTFIGVVRRVAEGDLEGALSLMKAQRTLDVCCGIDDALDRARARTARAEMRKTWHSIARGFVHALGAIASSAALAVVVDLLTPGDDDA